MRHHEDFDAHTAMVDSIPFVQIKPGRGRLDATTWQPAELLVLSASIVAGLACLVIVFFTR